MASTLPIKSPSRNLFKTDAQQVAQGDFEGDWPDLASHAAEMPSLSCKS